MSIPRTVWTRAINEKSSSLTLPALFRMDPRLREDDGLAQTYFVRGWIFAPALAGAGSSRG